MPIQPKNHFPPSLDSLLMYLDTAGRGAGSSTAVRTAWCALGGRLLVLDRLRAANALRAKAEATQDRMVPYGEVTHVGSNLTGRSRMPTLVDVDVVADLLRRLKHASAEVESLRAKVEQTPAPAKANPESDALHTMRLAVALNTSLNNVLGTQNPSFEAMRDTLMGDAPVPGREATTDEKIKAQIQRCLDQVRHVVYCDDYPQFQVEAGELQVEVARADEMNQKADPSDPGHKEGWVWHCAISALKMIADAFAAQVKTEKST